MPEEANCFVCNHRLDVENQVEGDCPNCGNHYFVIRCNEDVHKSSLNIKEKINTICKMIYSEEG